ncbi:MAG: SdrD B-like domain-containing protein, partial [Planctomycetales bacterium]
MLFNFSRYVRRVKSQLSLRSRFRRHGAGRRFSQPVNVSPAVESLEMRALLTELAQINGFVYVDHNNDGDRTGEAPIAGVTMTLTGKSASGVNVSRTTTTLADGSYKFTNLLPSDADGYKITETPPPPGYLDGKEVAGTLGGLANDDGSGNYVNDVISVIIAGSGAVGREYNFGELVPASISGFVYHDANNDGLFQGSESGIAGATVTLTGVNDLGNVVNLTAPLTGSSGAYSFGNLRPGTYKVTETQPSGYLDGKDTLGSVAPGGSSGTASDDMFQSIVLVSGLTLNAPNAGTQYNFGERLPAALGNYVWNDLNKDGDQDSDEPGLDGVNVTLTGAGADDNFGTSDDTTESQLTSGGGAYLFSNLTPGKYKVTFGAVTDMVLTTANAAGDSVDSDADPGTGTTGVYTLTYGEFNDTVDAGYYENKIVIDQLSSISGYVYHDSNNDGSRSGETGIAGATVKLTGTDKLGNSVNLTATTDANGYYEFPGLVASDANGYTLTETQPAGYLDGKDKIGTPGGSQANDLFSSIVLNAGVDGTENNFGELIPHPDLAITKTASIPGGTADVAGEVITYQITVQNTGNVGLTNVEVADILDETVDYVSGDVDGDTVLDVGESWIYSASYTVTQADLDYNGNALTRFADALPSQATMVVQYPGSTSYLDVTITNGGALDGLYKDWCIDTTRIIVPNTSYTANVYSSYQDIPNALGVNEANLDLVNWTINQVFVGQDSGSYGLYSVGDVQMAIWSLMGQAPGGGVSDTNSNRISQIVNAAHTQGEGFVPHCGDSVAVLLVPVDNAQITIAQVTLAEVDVPCDSGFILNVATVDTAETDLKSAEALVPVEQSARLSGFVYLDTSSGGANDGIKQAGEAGISGVTVTLTGINNLGAAVSLTATTNANGYYEFTGLRPSNAAGYTLTETQPAYLDGKDTIGTPGGTTTNDAFSSIVLNNGANGANNNFGELVTSSLSGYVYHDANNDGDRTGESGINGATVTLTGTDDLGNSVNVAVTTDASGYYQFTGLRPGTYVLTETQPASYLDGQDTVGTPGGTTTNDKFSNVVLTSGVSGTENNFGEVKVASIS